VALDITDKNAVEKVITEVNPDAVIHCAAWTALQHRYSSLEYQNQHLHGRASAAHSSHHDPTGRQRLLQNVGDRKGHDMRYAIDPTKIHNELGWLPETKFEDGIKKTIQWYLDNREWWETWPRFSSSFITS